MRIISGAQTGVDQMGLEVAKDLGLMTGGYAPKGFKTEKGNDPTLADKYGIKEHPSAEYDKRTEVNVQLSSGTIIFGDETSPGSKATLKFIKKHNKPYLINPTVQQIKEFRIYKEIINIAGNRGSKISSADLEKYRETLKQGLL